MKKFIKLIFSKYFILFSGFLFAQEKVVGQSDNYKLVWQDNFDGTKLDEVNNWTIVVNGNGGGNRELQYYKRENISVGKEPLSNENCLIITAKKENYLSKKCTSGRLSTQNKVSFKYGKIEARIKFPKTENGLWPAFWMLGSDSHKAVWPKCGEIDIVEMGNNNGIAAGSQDRFFNGACHWGEKFNNGKYPNYGKSSTNSYSLQDDFHLFTLIWDKDAVKMYVDMDKFPENKPYYEMPINGDDIAGKPARYFHKKFVILFNLAIGGNFTGIRNIDQITALKSGEAKMYIDFVRVYQRGDVNEEYAGPKVLDSKLN
jgi:beta-glucanase (GH16 family)